MKSQPYFRSKGFQHSNRERRSRSFEQGDTPSDRFEPFTTPWLLESPQHLSLRVASSSSSSSVLSTLQASSTDPATPRSPNQHPFCTVDVSMPETETTPPRDNDYDPSPLKPLLSPENEEESVKHPDPSQRHNTEASHRVRTTCCVGATVGSICLRLLSTFMEVVALKKGWSVSWIVASAVLVHVLWVRIGGCASHVDQTRETDAAAVPPHRAAQTQRMGSTVVVKAGSTIEEITLRTPQERTFNLELVDLSLPPAFLYVLVFTLPLGVFQNSVLYPPSTTLSLLPAVLLAATIVATQCLRIGNVVQATSQQHHDTPVDVLRQLRQDSRNDASLYRLLSKKLSSLTSETSVCDTTVSSNADVHNEGPRFMRQESNMTLVLGPLASDVLAPSPTMVFFEDELRQRQLFGAEADVDELNSGGINPVFTTTVPTRNGFLFLCTELLSEFTAYAAEFFSAVFHSDALPHLTLLTLGCLVTAFLAQSWINALLIVVYAGIATLLKRTLYRDPFHLIRRAHPFLVEYNLLLVQCGIASLLLLLSLQQVIFEALVVRDTLAWKVKNSGSWLMDWAVLGLASLTRFLANISAQRLVKTHTPQAYRWVEVSFVLVWFLATEGYRLFLQQASPPDLVLSTWGSTRTQAVCRWISIVLFFLGFAHFVMMRNRRASAEPDAPESVTTPDEITVTAPHHETVDRVVRVPLPDVPMVNLQRPRNGDMDSARRRVSIAAPTEASALELVKLPSRAEEKRGNIMESSKLDLPLLRTPGDTAPVIGTLRTPGGVSHTSTGGHGSSTSGSSRPKAMSSTQDAVQTRRAFRISKPLVDTSHGAT